MVMRVGVIGKDLHAVIPVDAGIVRASGTVRNRGLGNRELVAAVVRQDNGICGRSDAGFDIGARFPEMDTVGADVADFENPVASERALNGQVPLLRIRRDKMARDDETKYILRGNDARGGAVAAIHGRLRWVIVREALQHTEAGNEGGVEGARSRQCVGIWIGAVGVGVRSWRKKCAEAAGWTAAESDRQKRGLEGKLVGGADILSNVVNAVTGTTGGGVMATEVVGEAEARADAGGPIVVIGGVATGGSETSKVQTLYAGAVNEGILARSGEVLIEVANVAKVVMIGAEILDPQPEIQRQVLGRLPIVLRE